MPPGGRRPIDAQFLDMRKAARADRDFQEVMGNLISDRSLGLLATERE